MNSHVVSLLQDNKEKCMTGIYRLKGTIKHYDWGGISFIPSLLQIDNKEQKPYAEYWLGTHPLGISLVEFLNGKQQKLDELCGHLPYLFKAQEVKEMLSIQAHPSKKNAEIEFARENAAGIPLDAPHRNYKDDNHKPEMLVALGDFWLLHGFKPPKELEHTLLNVVELRELLPVYNESGYAGLYKYIMEMPQTEVNRILQPLVDNILPVYDIGEADKENEDFWAARAAKTFTRNGNIDRGIFSIYLFNIVHLKRGEAIFQDAGVPHAYLEGFNVELMANSDNVLRGGLTSKHIDVKELLKHVKCEPTHPAILQAGQVKDGEQTYTTPAPDFKISVFHMKKGETVFFNSGGAEIILLTDGIVELAGSNQRFELKKGMPSAIAFPGEKVQITAASEATVFRAYEPDGK
jgi:mannose-6-phosphate isomerase